MKVLTSKSVSENKSNEIIRTVGLSKSYRKNKGELLKTLIADHHVLTICAFLQ